MPRPIAAGLLALVPLSLAFAPESAISQAPPAVAHSAPTLTYADLADLADRAPLVAVVEPRDIVRLKPEEAPGVRAGMARVYVKARTRSVLVGDALGESVSYLADVALDSKGKLPKLKKQPMLVFGRLVPARPGELQLVAPDAQIAWDAAREAQVRAILTELIAPGAPPRVTGVREASHVGGNLVGEGETQIFLVTVAGDPVSITVLRRPGQARVWGVAFGEIVDQAARPPQPNTLAWYRLACFLPSSLPASTALVGEDASRAADDYRFVRAQLGPCPRNRSR